MDLKEHLTNIIGDISQNDTSESIDTSNKSKYNYSSKMENFMNGAVINKYARNWSRLEHKLKVKKIEEYVIRIGEKHSINESNQKNLLNILISRLRQNKLNKMSEITYDKEKVEITEIKKLKLEDNFFEFKD